MQLWRAGPRSTPGLLERLTHLDPAGEVFLDSYGLAELSLAIRRDLQDLLNTRRPQDVSFDGSAELQNSILAYGVPDLTAYESATPQGVEEIARAISAAITLFEPRLRDVRVTVAVPADHLDTTLHARIEARLAISPSSRLIFDSAFHTQSGTASVELREEP